MNIALRTKLANKMGLNIISNVSRGFSLLNNHGLNFYTKNFNMRFINPNLKRFFSTKEEDKSSDSKNEEAVSGEEETEKKITHQKYVELKTLYEEQGHKLELLRKKFEEIRKLYMENIDETEKIKARYTKEIAQTKDFAITKFAKDLLDVHDNFSRALSLLEGKEFDKLSNEEKTELFEGFVEGIKMVQSALTNTFKKHGVVEYIPSKEKFNPNKHEAVFDYEDEGLSPGTVGQVLESGFQIGERVLRPAKVGVIKKK